MDVAPEELEPGPDFFTQEGPGLFVDAPTGGSAPEEEAPLALYRRYRPEVFSEIIGQEHVTEPLKRALAHNRVNHAYLFSGPRGCGKTSSARILARSLNCEQGPTPDPCGVCESCRDLGRGGPGSIDVIEIDAASHGGVDDARDLRERAFFAPVHSRYKIYIVDEAHMVTAAGFNALLKLVEEPPPHVKFIFATTEPDKVIGTIRSRTHHYPFRLIPPKTMTAYLTKICAEENVHVDPGVLAMVVRAGGGSVRDSLSILDQLFGGATDDGVEYAQAAALLGYTPDSLLDSVVDAIADDDSKGVFAGIDKVIEAGQDPRRFTEDLLTRLRDLVIVAAVPDALTSGLLDVPDDQAERYVIQANKMKIGSLTRAAEVLAQGLVAMRGTTTPRLQLELMCARILLPGADAGERGVYARLERLERRLNITDQQDSGTNAQRSGAPAPQPAPVRTPAETTPVRVPAETVTEPAGVPGTAQTPVKNPSTAPGQSAQVPAERPMPRQSQPASGQSGTEPPSRPAPSAVPRSGPAQSAGPAQPAGLTGPGQSAGPAQSAGSGQSTGLAGSGQPTQPTQPARPAQTAGPAQPAQTAGSGQPAGSTRPAEPVRPAGSNSPDPGSAGNPTSSAQLGTDDIRRSWPQILSRVSSARRYVWMILNQYASVTELRGNVLWVTFSDAGARDNFNKASGEEHVASAIQAELGANFQVRARLESEPIPDAGTAIISLAKPVESASGPSARSGGQAPTGDSGGRAPTNDPGPERSADAGSDPRPAPTPRAKKPAPQPVEDPPEDDEDRPSDDDEVVENPADQAAELVMELFDAELVKEEQTKPRGRK